MELTTNELFELFQIKSTLKNITISSISTDSPIYLFEPELDSIIDERIELKFSTGSSAISTSKKLTSIVKLTVKAES